MEISKPLFIAIDLPDEVRTTLSSVSNYFQHPKLRWTPAQNLHVTTHFIGMATNEELPEIIQLTSVATAKSKPFILTFLQLKTITKRRKPVMLWAEFEKSDAFENLALQLQQALPGDDSKSPIPHVTLARIKEGGLKELPALPFVRKFSISVDEIGLYESHLGSGAPVYTVVKKFELEQ